MGHLTGDQLLDTLLGVFYRIKSSGKRTEQIVQH
ncbi:conserved hypothetical protein [Aspergillus fumigatus A1163]|uniref:Uncharacterized protein n=1 Tax=Aspergillus fumigatus (strain CBS 144.89 / FGSC A1163 / CEA10) TaxID=451804 RepID=B0YB96_ASPFC|nr:conserved hypothetical protein [Aspergillus fumigatus A1163]